MRATAPGAIDRPRNARHRRRRNRCSSGWLRSLILGALPASARRFRLRHGGTIRGRIRPARCRGPFPAKAQTAIVTGTVRVIGIAPATAIVTGIALATANVTEIVPATVAVTVAAMLPARAVMNRGASRTSRKGASSGSRRVDVG